MSTSIGWLCIDCTWALGQRSLHLQHIVCFLRLSRRHNGEQEALEMKFDLGMQYIPVDEQFLHLDHSAKSHHSHRLFSHPTTTRYSHNDNRYGCSRGTIDPCSIQDVLLSRDTEHHLCCSGSYASLWSVLSELEYHMQSLMLLHMGASI